MQVADELEHYLKGPTFRTISSMLASGDEEQRDHVLSVFYDRVCLDDDLEIRDIGSNFVVLNKGGFRVTIEKQHGTNRYRFNGTMMRDEHIAEKLGVPVSYLQGAFAIIEFSWSRIETISTIRDEIESLKKERAAMRKIAAKCENKKDRQAITKSFRRNAQKQIDAKHMKIAIAKASESYYEMLKEKCSSASMPAVPMPFIEREKLNLLEPFSGIYFAWDDLLCDYVGKSINVPSRVGNGHHKITGNCMMSYIELPASEINRAELYYIWLMNPSRNGGL